LNVLEAARAQQGTRVVFSSSCAVYGDNPDLPKTEAMPVNPLSPYAAHKLSGELNASVYAHLYGLETVCLRYFNVYGPRQDPSSPYSGVISIFLTRAAQGHAPTIFGDGNQNRDFIFVEDVVYANLLAAAAAPIGPTVLNIGTGHATSIAQLWDNIRILSGRTITPIFKPPRAGDIRKSVASIDRARTELGFSPKYTFEKGLEITYQWYKKDIWANSNDTALD
jgi:UDP-glucose 4-epimerase